MHFYVLLSDELYHYFPLNIKVLNFGEKQPIDNVLNNTSVVGVLEVRNLRQFVLLWKVTEQNGQENNIVYDSSKTYFKIQI